MSDQDLGELIRRVTSLEAAVTGMATQMAALDRRLQLLAARLGATAGDHDLEVRAR